MRTSPIPDRPLIVAAALTALALLAAACGGGDDGGSASGGGGDDPAEPVRGGEVVYALEAETSGGWCIPESQLAISGMMVARAIYDTLTLPDGEGGFAPHLAESVESNDDATEWTIRLRDGVTFHDGTALDAQVLKNNVDAWLGRYPARNALLFVFVLQNIDTVEIVDDLTLRITTKVPWPAFPAYLYGGGRLGIIAQAQLDDPDTCDRNLIGTGPFELEEWVVNDHLSATRNPDYWQDAPDGEPLPYLDRIEFRPIVDNQARVNGLLSGEFDIMHTSSASATDTLDGEADAATIDLTQTTVNTEVGFMMLNESKPPFDDPVARRAVATALDRQTYNEVVSLGLFEIANGPFPPGAPGYLDDTGFPEYDPDEAKRLVADYEKRTGSPLEFSHAHANDEENVRTAQFIQEQMARAGITVHLQTLEQAALISTALGNDWNAMAFRNFPGGVPDGNYVWWYGGSPVNFSKFDDAEVDRLLDTGRSELDEAAAVQDYEDLNRHLAEQVHFVWLDWTQWTIATQPEVHGVMGPPLPDGAPPAQGLATGHSVAGLWTSG